MKTKICLGYECTWMAAFMSAMGWVIYKQDIDQLIQFLLGVSFTIFIWVAV